MSPEFSTRGVSMLHLWLIAAVLAFVGIPAYFVACRVADERRASRLAKAALNNGWEYEKRPRPFDLSPYAGFRFMRPAGLTCPVLNKITGEHDGKRFTYFEFTYPEMGGTRARVCLVSVPWRTAEEEELLIHPRPCSMGRLTSRFARDVDEERARGGLEKKHDPMSDYLVVGFDPERIRGTTIYPLLADAMDVRVEARNGHLVHYRRPSTNGGTRAELEQLVNEAMTVATSLHTIVEEHRREPRGQF